MATGIWLIDAVIWPAIAFLDTMIIDNQYIFLSLWSIMHFFAGIILMYLLFTYKILSGDKRYWFFFFLLCLWELFEFSLHMSGYFGNYYFRESSADVAWDIMFGTFGGMLYLRLRNNVKS